MCSIVIDVETDYADYLHPMNPDVKCYMVGMYSKDLEEVYTPDKTHKIQTVIDQHDTIVGHNLKFDLSWLMRYGIVFRDHHKFYDTQTAEYILSGQKTTMASLNDLCLEYLGQEGKLDEVAELWLQGVATKDIDTALLAQYCLQDCKVTYQVYQAQLKRLQPSMRALMKTVMQDYKVVQEMEWEGLTFDYLTAESTQSQIKEELKVLYDNIYSTYDLGPWFNFSSPLHVSALLFGGNVSEERRVPNGVFKTGKRKGEQKFKKETLVHNFSRRYTPLAGTENQAGTAWQTSEPVLTRLAKKDKQGLLKDLMRIRILEKDLNTYYTGLLKKAELFHWPKDKIYGRFNTNTTRTGRLSSSQPNLQNLSPGAQKLFVSKYL